MTHSQVTVLDSFFSDLDQVAELTVGPEGRSEIVRIQALS